MTLPKNVEDLLAPNDAPPLTQDWHRQFAPYLWCRLAGFPERVNRELRAAFGPEGNLRPLLHKDGERRLRATNIRSAASGHVPSAWKQHTDFADLNWDQPLGDAQITAAISGHPITFDRACLVIAALDLLFIETGHKDEAVRKYVRIAPAIFYLDKFNERFFKDNFLGEQNRKRFGLLQALTQNTKPQFFVDLSKGAGATYATLGNMDHVLREDLHLSYGGEIMPFPERKRNMRAAAYENPVFPRD